jgi:Transposase domain (DUF772)
MAKLLVYGYGVGVFSSRRIQKRRPEDVPFRVLAAGKEPDFRTLSDFRKSHWEALQGLFVPVLEMALEAGAMKGGRVSLEGTKIKANASQHKAMSQGRRKEKQQPLKQEVKPLLAQAEAAEAEEEERPGRDRRGDERPQRGARADWRRSNQPRRGWGNGPRIRPLSQAGGRRKSPRPSQPRRINTTLRIRNRASGWAATESGKASMRRWPLSPRCPCLSGSK